MGFERGVNGLHEPRFVGALTFPPTSERRQGREFLLRMHQTCLQTCRLAGGMSRRAHHQHPFRPFLVARWRTTGSLKLIPLGCSHLLITVIDAHHPFQLTSLVFRHPLGDPCLEDVSELWMCYPHGAIELSA
jgi:hypothetical protein